MLATRLVVFGIAMVSQCSTLSAQGPYDPFKAELTAYLDCNAAGASEIWRQNGEPVSLAFAVAYSCREQEVALGRAMQRAQDAKFASEMLGHARDLAIKRNTAAIVKNRAYYLLSRPERKSL